MGKKMLINVLYSIVIFASIIIGYKYGVDQKSPQYGYIIGAVIIIVIFIVLKIRLLKEIKATQKP